MWTCKHGIFDSMILFNNLKHTSLLQVLECFKTSPLLALAIQYNNNIAYYSLYKNLVRLMKRRIKLGDADFRLTSSSASLNLGSTFFLTSLFLFRKKAIASFFLRGDLKELFFLIHIYLKIYICTLLSFSLFLLKVNVLHNSGLACKSIYLACIQSSAWGTKEWAC